MPRIVFSSLALLGFLLAVTGLLVQQRALSMHGKPDVPRGVSMNPTRWWPAWRLAGEMTSTEGVRKYVKGLELVDWGMTMVFFALGYILGRW
ncbi:MAG: hypothetical protein OEX18_14630 [Candidatus Krumholzibacteria bacterium]|nr:hypothetical protein [Candidatus Krumholzibacteria bacterium]MDH4338505.1 hypothetical protein [Candidatus Krumholzibacteria bacterium]MDH5270710.1 hypothetical protein [Candidatus Krumholzibacteria bacterium]